MEALGDSSSFHYIIAAFAIAHPSRQRANPQAEGQAGFSNQSGGEAWKVRHRIVIG